MARRASAVALATLLAFSILSASPTAAAWARQTYVGGSFSESPAGEYWVAAGCSYGGVGYVCFRVDSHGGHSWSPVRVRDAALGGIDFYWETVRPDGSLCASGIGRAGLATAYYGPGCTELYVHPTVVATTGTVTMGL